MTTLKALALSAGLFGAIASAQAGSVNLLTNGDFETGSTSGWSTGTPAPSSFTVFDQSYDTPLDGNYSASIISNTDPAGWSYITQTVLATAGQILTISAIAASYNSNDKVDIIVNGTTLETVSLGSWTTEILNITTTATTSNTITFGFYSAYDGSDSPADITNPPVGYDPIYFDDAVVTASDPVTAVPEPASMALLGAGLLGLGLLRRRKAS